ncbi:hypothetical protein, partial [Halapricum sp. CBA1109]|uniref:hypothetical protein n=1 Tax=Halapricum sp. CBA1109 TaxID=2668068 RepID=UPI00351B7177
GYQNTSARGRGSSGCTRYPDCDYRCRSPRRGRHRPAKTSASDRTPDLPHVHVVDGEMIDAPQITQARTILDRARAAGVDAE